MRWLHVLVGFCLVGLWWSTAWAEEPGAIRGVVRKDGQGIAEHRIMLIRFGPNQQDVQRIPGQTDVEGRFVFEQLETGPQFSYFVGIRYAEQLYRSAPIVLASGDAREGVLVEVGAAGMRAIGDAAPRLDIGYHIMVVEWQQDRIDVREVVDIHNAGTTPYQGLPGHAGQKGYSLHLPLPEGYGNFQLIQGLAKESLQSVASGLYYTAPLAPGTHRVVYAYALPMTDTVRMVLTRRTLPTRVFDIFVDTRQLVASSDVPFNERFDTESHSFFHFRGTNLEANSRTWLQVTRLATSTSVLRIMSYASILGMILLGVAIPLSHTWRGLWRPQRRQAVSVEQLQQWHTERVGLLRAMARLDDQYAAGVLDDATYRQSRGACKSQLLDIVEQLQTAQQDKDGAASSQDVTNYAME